MTTAGIIILGNSGVGKSFLANVILGTEAFVHKVRPTAVTLQTEYKPYQIDGKSYAVYNIPGLVEAKQERIDMNKREIDRAFVGHPYSVVVYVFSVTGGRIRDEDVVAFNAINKAYPLANKSLVIVVNNIPNMSADERSDYESEATPFLKTLLEIGFEHICYIYQLDPNSTDEKKAVRKELLKKIEVALPKIHKKEKEISLQVAELSNLKKQIADLQKQIEEDRKKARERDQEVS
jgi:predicted GTPase